MTLKFFLIGLSHDTLEQHYRNNFFMVHNHKYSLSELENMIPWERQIFIALLYETLQKEKEEYEKHKVR